MSTHEQRGPARRTTSSKAWLRRRRSLHLVRAETAVKERDKSLELGDPSQPFGVSKQQLRELTENRDDKEQVRTPDAGLKSMPCRCSEAWLALRAKQQCCPRVRAPCRSTCLELGSVQATQSVPKLRQSASVCAGVPAHLPGEHGAAGRQAALQPGAGPVRGWPGPWQARRHLWREQAARARSGAVLCSCSATCSAACRL